ncbi:MAG: hypothetical protein IJU00_12055 [Selenomonas sp.]|nr:hypothetical protein [Selenomonas sp.]
MNPVSIRGIGLITPVAGNAGELMELARNLLRDENRWQNVKGQPSPLEFSLGLPPSKVRRAPRLVKMAVAAAHQALEDAKIPDCTGEDIGTVLSTSYGTVESNVIFAESVVDAVPSLASPAVFPYTVPNSCLGQVCIVHGLQGPSTMLMGGDALEYSSLLLQGQKASYMLCGAVEEASPSLISSYEEDGILPADVLADGAVMFVLEAGGDNADGYCQVTAVASAALPACPYVSSLDDDAKAQAVQAMAEILQETAGEKLPDLVLTAENGSYFDTAEKEALQKAFGGQVSYRAAKAFFGEGLSTGYGENVALGAALIKAAKEQEKTVPRILAAGLDGHGNYLAALLEACL